MRAALAAMALLAATTLGACSPAAPVATPPPGAVVVTAEHTAFVEHEVYAAAGAPFTLYFANHDSEAHNVRILDAANLSVAATEIFTGPGASTVDIAALPAGTYRLLCDIHSEMNAQLIVQ